ncbi:glycosyltransferase [Candidatus Woesebacteria bacterium]|nr:glycosyltransferase [Candidatus Woesebacteria bacterium]MCD8527550.1 glycosyltransferase [Candidatus Woesebacteria bacterium]MCD8546290.1 glycosyltransferase [Candidatus Woesebacteria bacterium]
MGKITQLPLTLVLLSKAGEEPVPDRVQEYAPRVAHILVWDDGTGDETTLVDLQQFSQKVRVEKNPLQGNFASHRNDALDQVETEWTFFLDADEYAGPEVWQEITTALQEKELDAVLFPRRDIFLGHQLRYGETGHTTVLRLARTYIAQGKWQRAVHEVWEIPTERVLTTKHALLHTPHPTVTEFLQKLQWYASLEAKARHRTTKLTLITQLLTYPVAKFFQNYFWRRGALDGFPGLVHALLMSYYSLITRVYLYEAWYA